MSLQDWLKAGWLTQHKTSRQEVADLLGVVDRDLADSQTPRLSADWQLNIAYNAAIQAATAALAAAGYLAAREAHHYRVIQSLAHTVGTPSRLIAQLDGFRKKRNIGEYQRAGSVSDREAQEMLALAKRLRADVDVWLREHHPQLL